MVVNKVDSEYHHEQYAEELKMLADLTQLPIFCTSALNNLGTDALKEALYDHFFANLD